MFQHPLVRGIAVVAIFVVTAEIVVGLTSFAWAAISVPIPLTNYTINLGELPQWVIAIVAALGLWKSWRIEKHMAEVALQTTATATDMRDVKHETNSMRTAIEAAKLAEGILAGRKEAHEEIATQAAVDKQAVRTDAISDAETAATIKTIETPTGEKGKET
jgi:uncharacterized protein YqgV (UPF0045/DUF77 family)